jgi:hypothetical protein
VGLAEACPKRLSAFVTGAGRLESGMAICRQWILMLVVQTPGSFTGQYPKSVLS